MPIETEGLEHNRECPECKGALTESIGYDLCPHCGHRLSGKESSTKTASPRRTRQWQCPQCANWDYESQGRYGPDWHDCKNCGYRESSPTQMSQRFSPLDWDEDEQGAYDYDEWTDEAGNPHLTSPAHPDYQAEDWEEQYPQDAPHDQLDDPWNQPRHAKFHVVALGEMQQPGGVGATQTTGLTDGEGIQHPDDHSEMSDAGQNSFEQNVALETWVNFAVDMLNRGKSEQEVSAQLAHDGCPEPEAVLKRAIEQPQQDPVGNEGAADPFETPPPSDATSNSMESVSQQPPVLAHWLGDDEETVPSQQVRIAGTSWRGIELDRWEDLYGQKMARIALSDGGIVTVAAEVVEPDGDSKAQDPATEIQNFIDGLPEVEPTRPSIIARIANLKMARTEIRGNISKCGFSDQVKLERLDRTAGDEILELTDFLGRLASDSDQQYVREQQRYRAAGKGNREVVTNEAFNARIAETAAIFVSELAPEVKADRTQVAYAAAHYAQSNNGDVSAFVAAAQKYAEYDAEAEAERRYFDRLPGGDMHGEVRGWNDYPEYGEDDIPFDTPHPNDQVVPGSARDHHGPDFPNDLDPLGYEMGEPGRGGMSDEDYWAAREHGEHPDHDPAEDPFAVWPGGHPMDR